MCVRRMCDDLLLVSASIHKQQFMVDICCSEAAVLYRKFNASKSQAFSRIGRSCCTDKTNAMSHDIRWLCYMFG